jgi:hypothetical protein
MLNLQIVAAQRSAELRTGEQVKASKAQESMATEFERAKYDIGGHSVMITSWYDDRQEAWRASAPAYAAVLPQRPDAAPPIESRTAAIDQVIGCLLNHFDTDGRA